MPQDYAKVSLRFHTKQEEAYIIKQAKLDLLRELAMLAPMTIAEVQDWSENERRKIGIELEKEGK